MKRATKTGLAVVSLLALTATASAGPFGSWNNNGGQPSTDRQYGQRPSKQELFQKLTKKFHKPKPIPIDPGRGDGHTPTNPQPQPPQGPPGFIFVNGHWERVRAPGAGTPGVPHNSTVVVRDHRTETPGTVIVRDHRTESPGTVIVRDHRTDASGTVIIRDHRNVTPDGGWQVRPAPPKDVSSSPGGVTVTSSPRSPIKDQGVVVRDHRTGSGNAGR
jgi:hypothetical protein